MMTTAANTVDRLIADAQPGPGMEKNLQAAERYAPGRLERIPEREPFSEAGCQTAQGIVGWRAKLVGRARMIRKVFEHQKKVESNEYGPP